MSSASQPLDDGSQPPPVDIDTLYFEVVGREKRRRVYGLGSRAASIYPSSCQSTGSSHSIFNVGCVKHKCLLLVMFTYITFIFLCILFNVLAYEKHF